MAPEREISNEELDAIEKWISNEKEQSQGFLHERVRKDAEVYLIDNEPLVIIYEDLETSRLFCSEKHAQELEEAGIVSFSEVKEEAK